MTADHTMTDTTKPTGDTIDDAIMELANIMCGEPEICEEHWEAAESAIKAGYRRLAERPNRAVARGDSVTVRRYDLAALALVGAPTLQVTDEAAYNRLSAALTTPTETTDPAMKDA